MPAARSAITPAHYQLLAALRHGLSRFLHFSREAARRAGLTPQQHQALLAIKGFTGPDRLSVGRLAGRLHVRHHSAVGLVDRLVRRRLVRRVTSRIDRRRVNVQLTARGETLIRQLSTVHLAELRQHGPELHRLLASIIRS